MHEDLNPNGPAPQANESNPDLVAKSLSQEGNLSRQLALGMSSVLILGNGGTRNKTATHLALAGVGKIVLAGEGMPILETSLKEILNSLPNKQNTTKFALRETVFDAHLAEALIGDVDLVIDCLADWQDKLLASDVCMNLRKTLMHSGGSGMRFQIYAMRPGKSACLRCALPLAGIDDVPLLPEAGQCFEPIVAMLAAMQALETIKILARIGVSQGNELLKFDGLSGEFEVIRGLDPRRDCPDCGPSR